MFETEQSLVNVNLRRLLYLRGVIIVGQCLLISLSVLWYGIQLPLVPMFAIIAIYALVSIITLAQLRRARDTGINSFFLQVSIDVIEMAAMLYLSGGASNPFVSMLLLPLIIITSTMPRPYIWTMAVITIVAYSLLMLMHEPVVRIPAGDGEQFHTHVLGMWVNFVVTITLLVTFLLRMAESIRERDNRLARNRELMLQDESLLALGTVAAGAAHEIATPLATMAIVAGELETQLRGDPELLEQVQLLRQQVGRCRDTLDQMTARAGSNHSGSRVALDRFLGHTIAQWQNMRPHGQVELEIQDTTVTPEITSQVALTQAIVSLMNNAADAGENHVNVHARWDDSNLVVEVCDRGPGLPEQHEDLGKLFYTTKSGGQGLGLYLARAVVSRLGGNLILQNRDGGGVQATVTLPLKALA